MWNGREQEWPSPASVNARKFEAPSNKQNQKRATGIATVRRGIVSLSIETKVAIAVATGFLVMVVGAVVQG